MTSNAERMRRLFERAWNDGDMDVVDEIVSEDFVFSRGGDAQAGGPELYRELIAFTSDTFPDMAFELEDVIVGEDGETVVVRWTMVGTHEGPYKGVAPTGQRVTIDGVEINRFDDGELAETWTYPNWVDFLEEVGALPYEEGDPGP